MHSVMTTSLCYGKQRFRTPGKLNPHLGLRNFKQLIILLSSHGMPRHQNSTARGRSALVKYARIVTMLFTFIVSCACAQVHTAPVSSIKRFRLQGRVFRGS
jgi:hypothetical protein